MKKELSDNKAFEELFCQFNGQDIKISIDYALPSFDEIKMEFDKYKIPFNTFNSSSWGFKPEEKFALRFNSETNFQNLYLLSMILRNYGLTSIDYWGDKSNEICIGLPASDKIDVDLFLLLPFETNIKTFLSEYFNVENTTIDIRIRDWIRETYNIQNPEDCSEKDIARVKEIYLKDKYVQTIEGLEKYTNLENIKLPDNKIKHFDMSNFPNLKVLDISYNPVEKLDISKNEKLEQICYSGLRGCKLSQIDFSNNPRLKKIIGGQDGLSQIDLSTNLEIEDIEIRLSSDLRYIDLTNCSKLKRIILWGVKIPFVNLTKNYNLEHVEINYLNTYKNYCDMFGNGYPRPIIFVAENFDENVINLENRNNSYYCYVLAKVKKDSKEEKVLQTLENMKSEILEIGKFKSDDGFISRTEIRRIDKDIANFHYHIMSLLND